MEYTYKYTVFTPCYNSEKTLHRVFDSLMSQTIDHKEFEWVVINDCSKDGTHNLMQEYIKNADFAINYINLEKNQMIIKNYVLAIQQAKGNMFLAIGHDDAFEPETMSVMSHIWDSFSDEEKEKCGGISVLCKDQNGNNIGVDYPITNKLISTVDVVFEWANIGLGETWGAIKTQNLKKSFVIPEDAKDLVYIPESFFWNRLNLELKPYSYYINQRLRVYYVDEGGNLSQNIRDKYPQGFLFESKWFITHYPFMLYKYPKMYIKHLLKYIYFSIKRFI